MKRSQITRIVVVAVLLALFSVAFIPGTRVRSSLAPQQAVRQAWRNVRTAEVYQYSTELVQTTYPAPALSNIGETARQDVLFVEGRVDLPQETLEMTLRQQTDPFAPQDGVEIRVEGDASYGRVLGASNWRPLEQAPAVFAPENDALAFLAGARNIAWLATETRDLPGQSLAMDRYSFTLDGPALADYMRQQLEGYLRDQGRLPAGVHLSASEIYKGMQGEGEVWVDDQGLPLRISLEGELPALPNGERQALRLRTDFSGYDRGALASAQAATFGGFVQRASGALGLPTTARGRQQLAQQGLLMTMLVGGMALLMLYARRTRVAYAALMLVLIFSMVGVPVLEALNVAEFNTWLASLAPEPVAAADASTTQPETAASAWLPNAAPVGRDLAVSAATTNRSALAAATSGTACDNKRLQDSDGDGLTEKQECLLGTSDGDPDSDDDGLSDGAEARLGTDPLEQDTDLDRINDAQEVNAYDLGKPWYSNPTKADTNKDGILDGLECPERMDGKTGVCRDTDGDRTPDIWDEDNDNDGVVDSLDLSPDKVAGSGTAFTRAQPFKLAVSGLQQDKPLLVDFQIRPTNPDHLAYTLNIFDWPTGDNQGNVQETHNKTFADFMTPEQQAAMPAASQGDFRLVPMLEIVMDTDPLPMVPAQATYTFDENSITGAVTLTQQGTNIAISTDIQSSGVYTIAVQSRGPCGDLKDARLSGAVVERTNLSGAWQGTVSGKYLTDLANSQHVIYLYNDTQAACLTMMDLPNGGKAGQMVDMAFYQPYGVAVRDTGAGETTVVAYVPLTLATEDNGGRKAAFAARMPYKPNNAGNWGMDNEVRVAWLVQMLTASGGSQTVHTYYDEWTLTGLSLREDHGLQAAVAFEDPTTDNDRNLNDRLLALGSSLEKTFIMGRRDITRDEIVRRFDRLSNGSVSAQARWALPQDAFRVYSYDYPTEDYLSKIMMEASPTILQTHFSAADVPTLLFAFQMTARVAELDGSGATTLSGNLLKADMNQVEPLTIGSMSWAPYRHGADGWESYPMKEYWDHLDVRLAARFPVNTGKEEQRAINRAIVTVAKLQYLTLNHGMAGMRQAGNEFPDWEPALETDEDLVETWEDHIGDAGEAIQADVEARVETWVAATEDPKADLHLGSGAGGVNRVTMRPDTPNKRLLRVSQALDGKLTALETRHPKVNRRISAGYGHLSTAVGLASMITSVNGDLPGADYVDAASSTIDAIDGTMEAVSTMRTFARGGRLVTKAARTAGAAGLIVESLTVFAQFTAEMIISKAAFGSLTFNSALAEAISTTIVAGMMFALSITVPVGTIAAAIIAAIDGVISAVCAWIDAAKGENDEGKSWSEYNEGGKRFCEGISGLLAALIKIAVYAKRPIVGNMQSPNRLNPYNLGVDFLQPDYGFTVDYQVAVSLDIENKIIRTTMLKTNNDCFSKDDDGKCVSEWEAAVENDTIPLPFDPLAVPYLGQLNDSNAKKATFSFQLSDDKIENAHDNLSLGGQSWDYRGQGTSDRNYYHMEVKNLSRNFTLEETGINRPINAYLVEAAAVPNQECIGVPTPPLGMPIIPVCWVRAEKITNNLPLSSMLQYDIFPKTLDEFRTLAEVKNEAGTVVGYAPAWGQTGDLTFAVVRDADNDGLPFTGDSDDAKWDQDGDGLSDQVEAALGTKVDSADSDGDGLSDDFEVRWGTRPTAADTDGDGLSDGDEWDGWEIVYEYNGSVEQRTWVYSDPLQADADSDQFTDVREKIFGLSPYALDKGTIFDYQVQLQEQKAPQLLLRFEQDSGARGFVDESGYDNGATCTGEACPTLLPETGRYGNGLRFDGANDALSVAGLKLANQSFSVAFWAKRDSTDLDRTQWVLSQGIAAPNQGLHMGFRDRNQVTCAFYGNDLNAPAPVDDAWHHYICTYDADSNQRTLYVDGNQAAQDTAGADYQGSGALFIGRLFSPHEYFRGAVDEVTVFAYPLAGDDLKAALEGRYNPNDLIVNRDTPLEYNARVTNNRPGRFAHGLVQVSSQQYAVSGSHIKDFELKPQEVLTFTAGFNLSGSANAGTVDLAASARIVDRREQSGYSDLWLPFNETGEVSLFRDFSGVNLPRNGRCSGGCPATGSTGISGRAVYFDGSDNAVSVERLDMADHSFSVAFWAKRDPTDLDRTQWVLGQGTAAPNQGLHMGFRDRNQVTCAFYGNDLNAPAPADDEWHQYTCTFDANSLQRTVYVDGVQVAQDTAPSRYTGSGTLHIGRAFFSGERYRGYLDEVRVFNRTLFANEASELANIRMLYYEFDENASNTAPTDRAGSNHGVCRNIFGGGTCPDRLAGIKGNAASFGGREFFITKEPVDLTSGRFSLAFWLYPESGDAYPQGILGTADLNPWNNPTHMIGLERVGRRLRFGFGTMDRNAWYRSGEILNQDAWNHVVLAFDRNANPTTRIYINGVQRATSRDFSGQAPVAPATLEIGRSNSYHALDLGHLYVHDEADGGGDAEALVIVTAGQGGDLIGDSDNWWQWTKGSLEDDDNPDVSNPPDFMNSARIRVYEDDSPEGRLNDSDELSIDFTLDSFAPGRNKSSRGRNDADFELDYSFTNPAVPLKGSLDELAIYGRPLSAEDASAQYRAGTSSGHLPLDEPPATLSFRDATSASALSVGTVRRDVANCQAGSCPVSGVAGRSGRAVSFTDRNQYIDWDTNVSDNEGALSFWFKTTRRYFTGNLISREADFASSYIELHNDQLCVRSGTEKTCTSDQNYGDGNWHHVVQTVAPTTDAYMDNFPYFWRAWSNYHRLVGRYVRVQLAGSGYLSLAEVQVLKDNNATNLAAGKPATQSSLYPDGDAAKAVDGNTDGDWNAGSVTHTDYDAQPWWEVDLGASQMFDNVTLWNRTDSATDRLKDFYIFVSEAPFPAGASLEEIKNMPGVWHTYHSGPMSAQRTFAASGFKMALANQKLYVDGVEVLNSNYVLPGNATLRLGGGFSGNMDEVRIYSGAQNLSSILNDRRLAPKVLLHLDSSFDNEAGTPVFSCSDDPDDQCPTPSPDGRVGEAFTFDGDNDVLQATGSIVSSLNFAAWAKRGDSGRFQWLMGGRYGSTLYRAGFTNDDRFECTQWSYSGGTARYQDGGRTVDTYTDQRWNHWACIDGQIYRNGQPAEMERASGSFTEGRSITDGLTIGADWNGIMHFRGSLDEVYVWAGDKTYVPTPIEMRELYLAEEALVAERVSYAIEMDHGLDVDWIGLPTHLSNAPTRLGISAAKDGRVARRVELKWRKLGETNWRTVSAAPCQDGAAGGASWCPLFAPEGEGRYGLGIVAYTITGLPLEHGPFTVSVDATAPNLTLGLSEGALVPLEPDAQGSNNYRLNLSGTAADPDLAGGGAGSGVASVQVLVRDGAGNSLAAAVREAQMHGDQWSLAYPISVERANGPLDVGVTAVDAVGNETVLWRRIHVDTAAPDLTLDAAAINPGQPHVISETARVQGTVASYTLPEGAALYLPLDEVAGATIFGHNYALGRPTLQHSTQGTETAQQAVDGDPGTMARTTSAAQPWWQVDLGAVQHVDSITLNLPQAVDDVRLYFSAVPFTSTVPTQVEASRVWRATPGNLAAGEHVLLRGDFSQPGGRTDTPLLGRYLRVQLGGTGTLAFNEVQVNGPRGSCTGDACPAVGEGGIHSTAARFDGTGDTVTVPHDDSLSVVGDLTLAAWIYPTGNLNGETLFSKHFDGEYDLTFRSNRLNYYHGPAWQDNTHAFDYEFSPNAWVHVAVVRTSADKSVRLYVNGVEWDDAATYQSAPQSTTHPLYIGSRGGTGSFFSGLVDGALVYDRALGAGEIQRLARHKIADVAAVEVAFALMDAGSPFYNERPPHGQVLHLPMDDMPNKDDQLVVKDISGNGLNGTCQACPAIGELGRRGGALGFDGVGDTVRVGHDSHLDIVGDLTLMAWIYPTGDLNGKTLLSKNFVGEYDLTFWNGKLNYYHGPAWQDNTYTFDYIFRPETWYHVAVVRNSDTKRLRLYVNGIAQGAEGSYQDTPVATQNDVIIGARRNTANPFSGSIDDVRILNRALDEAEIRQITLGSEPVLWLPFDEPFAANGTQLEDISGWGHEAVLSAADATNKVVAGRIGPYALHFAGNTSDGGNDAQIRVPHSDYFNFDGSFSIALWMRVDNFGRNWAALVTKGDNSWRLMRYDYHSSLGFGTTGLSGPSDDILGGHQDVEDGQWHHVAAVFDGSTKYLYIDGQLDASVAVSGKLATNSYDVLIGENAQAINRHWDGDIDDVRLYARALSAAEVQAMAQSGWRTAALTPTATGRRIWSLPLPAGLEGSYRLNLRTTDTLGNLGIIESAWQGSIDTAAPRLALTTQAAGNQVRYTTAASDFNMVEGGFNTPCGAGNIGSREVFQSAWYKALVGANTQLVGLGSDCQVTPAEALSEVGVYHSPNTYGVAASHRGTLVYIASADQETGLQIFDTTHPAQPVKVGEYVREWSSFYDVAVSPAADMLYMADGYDGVRIIDITTRALPRDLGAYRPPGANFVTKIYASPTDSVVYFVSDNVLFAVDVSQPTAQTLLGTFDLTGNVKGITVAPDGDRVYVVSDGHGAQRPDGMLRVIDVSQPVTPTQVGMADFWPSPYLERLYVEDVAAAPDGDHIYIADGRNGLTIVDVSDPTNPNKVGEYETTSSALHVAVAPSGDYVYLGLWDKSLMVLDVRDPTQPAKRGNYDLSITDVIEKMVAAGDMLYVAARTNGLRIIRFNLGNVSQATACDTAGNCTTTPFPAPSTMSLAGVSESTAAMALQAAPDLEAYLDTLPTVLDAAQTLTVTGTAYGDASLHSLALALDGTEVYTQSWASGAVTETGFAANVAISGEGAHTLSLELTDWAGGVYTNAHSFILDTQPPQVGLSPRVFTATHLSNEGFLTLRGPVTDTGGIAKVAVTVDGQSLRVDPAGPYTGEPLLTGAGEWRAFWPQAADALPDGITVPVTVTVTDVAYRSVTLTDTLTVDLVAPTALTPTVTAIGVPVTPGATISTTMYLGLTWDAGTDGSGISGYAAGWRVETTGDATTTQAAFAPGDDRKTVFGAPEGSKVTALLQATDAYGNLTTLEHGPFYVDNPLTPDYVQDLNRDYTGWLDSGCTLLGTDVRIRDHAVPYGTLDDAQNLYATWNSDALRLTWTGADWDNDGDLFIYLDTRYGGSMRAYDPYTSTQTLVFLPASGGHGGVAAAGMQLTEAPAPAAISLERWQHSSAAQRQLTAGLASSADAFGADYLIWVQDSTTAQLLVWDAASASWQANLGLSYAFGSDEDGLNQTDLLVPLSALGIGEPTNTPVSLVALASDDADSQLNDAAGLQLWATFPTNNPANSPRLLDSTLLPDVQLFALTQPFRWANIGADVCPNGVRETVNVTAAPQATENSYNNAAVRVELAANPAGLTYRFLGDNLFELMPELPLFASAADWDAALAELCAANPDAPSCERQPDRIPASTAENQALAADLVAKADMEPGPPGTRGTLRADAVSLAATNNGAVWDPVDGLYGRLSAGAEAVGDGQAVVYTFTLSNRGNTTARGLVADMLTFGPLRLPEGTLRSDTYGEYYTLVKALGDLAPGEILTVAIAGKIDYTFDVGNLPAGLANLDLVVYDSHGSPLANQLEWAFVTYPLDQDTPITVLRPETLLAKPGENALSGRVYDQSLVRDLELAIELPNQGSKVLPCTDETPADGAWACTWDAGAVSDGADIRVRARSTDVHGQTGNWSRWLSLTVDGSAPTLTLDTVAQEYLSDGLLGPQTATLSGALSDNRLVEAVDVCVLTDDGEVCAYQDVTLDTSTLITSAYVYDDAPVAPLPLGREQGCQVGQAVHRVFSVAEDFSVADAEIGLSIEHPYRYDVSAWLQAPSGTWTPLLWNAQPGAQNYDVWLSDSAGSTAENDRENHILGDAHYEHVLRPAGLLGMFRGEVAQGDWVLVLCDYFPDQDDGAYHGAQLQLTAATLPEDTRATWSYDVLFPGDVDYEGPETLHFYAFDSQGHRSTAPVTATFMLDNVPPQLTVRPYRATQWQATASDGSGVLDVYAEVVFANQQVRVQSLVQDGNIWVFDTTPLERLDFQAYIVAIDAAGNQSRLGPFEYPQAIYLPLVSNAPVVQQTNKAR